MDFIDDEEVSKALFDAANKIGKETWHDFNRRPYGFTPTWTMKGFIEGFDEMGTMATIYNTHIIQGISRKPVIQRYRLGRDTGI